MIKTKATDSVNFRQTIIRKNSKNDVIKANLLQIHKLFLLKINLTRVNQKLVIGLSYRMDILYHSMCA